MSQLKRSGKALPLPFCSIWALDGLGDAHPHWEGQSALLNLFKF